MRLKMFPEADLQRGGSSFGIIINSILMERPILDDGIEFPGFGRKNAILLHE